MQFKILCGKSIMKRAASSSFFALHLDAMRQRLEIITQCPHATPWARATNNVKKPLSQVCESCRKLDLRFLQNKTESFLVSVPHLILRFTIVQNKF